MESVRLRASCTAARWSRPAVCALAWAALACAITPPHEHEIRDGWRGAPEVTRVLVAPMNATGSIAEELQEGADRIFELIGRRFEARGIAVETVPYHRFRNYWTQSFAGVELAPGQTEVPEVVIATLAGLLGTHHDFDLLVMPGVEFRSTHLVGRSATWDGVRRQLRDESGRSYHWKGNPAAPSLHVRAYRPSGERVFDGFGGLDMVFKYARGSQMQLVEDPLSDEEHLEEGVRIALDPLIPFDT